MISLPYLDDAPDLLGADAIRLQIGRDLLFGMRMVLNLFVDILQV